jgi:hypothetical protein
MSAVANGREVPILEVIHAAARGNTKVTAFNFPFEFVGRCLYAIQTILMAKAKRVID